MNYLTRLSFKARNGTAVDDDVLIAHSSGYHHKVAEAIATLLEPSSITTDKFVVIADEVNSVYDTHVYKASLNGVVEVTTVA